MSRPCPIERFNPSFLLKSAHLQTILGSLLPAPKSLDTKINLNLALGTNFSVSGQLDHVSKQTLAIVLHGLGGSYQSNYIQRLRSALIKEGISVACLNLPGQDSHTPYLYHAGEHVRFNTIETYFKKRYHRIVWIGFSFSANMILNWLSQRPQPTPAIAISPAINLALGAQRIDQKRNFIYGRYFVCALKRLLQVKMSAFPERFMPYQKALRARSIYAFDQLFTCPFHGFSTVDAYYKQFSSIHHFQNIQSPIHIIASVDDPFTDPLEMYKLKENPHIQTHYTQHGGHVGFMETLTKRNSTLNPWITTLFKEF